jgi:hypothetical protein
MGRVGVTEWPELTLGLMGPFGLMGPSNQLIGPQSAGCLMNVRCAAQAPVADPTAALFASKLPPTIR